MKTGATTEQLIEAFCHRQLMQAMQAGSSLGFSPITVAASLMQISASALVSVSPSDAAAVLRAYADVIDAGPGESPARAEAIASFLASGEALLATGRAGRDFPVPQGRA